MKKLLLILCSATLLLSSCTKEQIEDALNSNGSLTNEEVIAGLKEALNVGTDTSVSILHKTDGYFRDELVKILLPPEAKKVIDIASTVPGMQSLVDQTVLAMNRAAEDAASEAKPIFVNAVTSMTIGDGFDILNGSDTAATHYLRGKTYDSLEFQFQPKIHTSLTKPLVAGVSAESAYANLISAYNAIPLVDDITTNSLSTHVTTKALDGLFLKVAMQEKNIRKDPVAQVTDLLKKVFGSKK